MDSLEPLSIEEIHKRLSEVRKGAAHLRAHLPADSPYNATLRLVDIARYIGVEHQRLSELASRRKMSPEQQLALSRFFRGWDRGRLRKARVGTEWRIVGGARTNEALAQVAAPPGEAPPEKAPKVIRMAIDMTAFGPKLRQP